MEGVLKRLDSLEEGKKETDVEVAKMGVLEKRVAKMDVLEKRVAKMDVLEKRVAKVDVLEQKVALLQPFCDEALVIRKTVLDELGWGRDEDLTRYRNRLVHGGHIVADLSIINQARILGGERFARWKRAFQRLYEVEYDEIKNEVEKAPPAIIDAYNMRANISVLTMWQEMQTDGAAIKKDCDGIIEKWQHWLASGKKGTEPDVEDEYRKVKDDYDNCRIRRNCGLGHATG